MLKRVFAPLATLGLLVGVAACGGTGDEGGSGSKKLTLVAYSTPKEAYSVLIPAFQKTAAGKGVTFDQSYGSSGEQSRAVDSGLPADVVTLSLEPDMTKLVEAGKVAKNWNQGPEKGFVTNSVVVFATRPGNPKNIKTWADLVKPGVKIVTPNPFTSGSARWNIMAAYGAAQETGATDAQAEEFLAKLLKNTVSQDKSAREALSTFDSGQGDVLLAYENEALVAKEKGIKLDYVVPDQTILIQNPIAVVEGSKNADAAKAFIAFLRSEQGQKIFAEQGYRPINGQTYGQDFPKPPELFEITKFGGWSDVTKKFFDPEGSIVADIEKDLGVSTTK